MNQITKSAFSVMLPKQRKRTSLEADLESAGYIFLKNQNLSS